MNSTGSKLEGVSFFVKDQEDIETGPSVTSLKYQYYATASDLELSQLMVIVK